jgi:NDP-sugar pyrophosphorylase family protein
MKKIITLSGHSQRFLDEGFTIKPLIKIGEKYIIEYVVDSIYENYEEDYSNYIFIVKNDDINLYNIDKVLNNLFPNCVVKNIPTHSEGPVFSILSIIDDVCNKSDEILVSYCDLHINWNISEFINFVRDGNYDGSIVSHTGFHPHRINNKYFAYMQVNGKDVLKIQEKKPFTDEPETEYASGGIYYFKTCEILKHYFLDLANSNNRVNNEFYVTMSYNKMVDDGLKVSHYDSKNYVCLGTPMDVLIFTSSLNLLKYFNSYSDIERSIKYFDFHYISCK